MGRGELFEGRFDALLTAARSGDQAALGRIYARLAPIVAGYARVQGALEPEDLTSEVFVGVIRNLDRFTGDEAAFRSWVFTIAHRRLLDQRRAAGRRPHQQPLPETADPVAPDDVEDDVERALATERVRSLCVHLVPDQRDVLMLRLVAQLTVPEVAAALGKSIGAVKALQRRGLAAVERLLAEEGVPS